MVAFGLLPSGPAMAADALGLYVGGAIGQAQVEAGNLPNPSPGGSDSSRFSGFRENHSAYGFIAGLRPVSSLGAEVTYVDLGHPARSIGTLPVGLGNSGGFPVSANVQMKGAGAFAVLYLPVPVVDIFVKAGLGRLQTTASSTVTVTAPYATCVTGGGPHCQFTRENKVTNTGLAEGVGAQVRFGSVAVRGEYQRFSAAGANPGLFSLGLTWTFL